MLCKSRNRQALAGIFGGSFAKKIYQCWRGRQIRLQWGCRTDPVPFAGRAGGGKLLAGVGPTGRIGMTSVLTPPLDAASGGDAEAQRGTVPEVDAGKNGLCTVSYHLGNGSTPIISFNPPCKSIITYFCLHVMHEESESPEVTGLTQELPVISKDARLRSL